MFKFNEHIKKELLNEYGGSDRKRTVMLDDGKKYLLKFPDPSREKHSELSYISNVYSEYIGCKIIESIGLPVQKVILGEYTDERGITKIACACEDVRLPGETMHEIEKLQLGSLDPEEKEAITFKGIERIFDKLSSVIDRDVLSRHFYRMFIADTLIVNSDRHNGNWAVLSSASVVRLCPIYDCGSSLAPLLAEHELTPHNIERCALDAVSALRDENGARIKYTHLFRNELLPEIAEALKSVLPAVNLQKVEKIIQDTEKISPQRKAFYIGIINLQYERVLLPALEKVLNPTFSTQKIPLSDWCQLYTKDLSVLRNIGYQKQTVNIQEQDIIVSQAGKNHAFLYDQEKCIAVLDTRSNNDAIRETIGILREYGLHIQVPVNKREFEKAKSEIAHSALKPNAKLHTDVLVKNINQAKQEASGKLIVQKLQKSDRER